MAIKHLQPPNLQEPEQKKVMYTVSSWAGLTKYECALCPYDTLVPDQMAGHIASIHMQKTQPAMPSGIVIADKNYNVISEPAQEQVGVYEIEEKEINLLCPEQP
jgi:hypothetical protein